MKLTSFLLQSRGPINLAKRIPAIVTRFGVTERKIDGHLNRFVDITGEFGARPTLAITANLLDRYPELVKGLSKRNLEFAVHGLVHTDYSQLSLAIHLEHLNKAIDVFGRHNVRFTGFRCPYLRSNEYTAIALKRLGFKWDSTDVIAWDLVPKRLLKGSSGFAYKKLLDFYNAKSSVSNFSVPRIRDGLVEIPVSIPDDEAIVDRLGIGSAAEIAKMWLAILDASFERGDIFTIQLHHERVPILGQALYLVLQKAMTLWPGVFIASLGEIADWYLRRDRFLLKVEDLGSGRYCVEALADPDATILVKNARIESCANDVWFDGYRVVHNKRFVIRSRKRPVIGSKPGIEDWTAEFLRGEGFVVERTDDSKKYSLSVSDFENEDEVSLVRKIENSGAPLIRLWRWPDGNRSAIAITGDIDSITLVDFARRIFEVRNERAA